MSYEKVEDTFFEAFEGKYVRALITGPNEKIVRRAAFDSTSTPSAVIGRVEGGVEGFLSGDETPDGRPGAVVQYWLGGDDVKKFAFELSYRLRQDILVKPFTRIFDYSDKESDEYIEMMDIVGHCGDGYEWIVEEYGRKMINVPIAVPDFQIEEKFKLNDGIMGGNFWYLCSTPEAVLEAGEKALKAIENVEGAIAPFDICSAASKPETNYPEIGPTTNHVYCPSLKDKLGDESKVAEGVNYIPEIVFNAVDEDSMNAAMKAAIDATLNVDGVIGISAGNYDGKLGDKKVNLLDIL
ncbi:MAG: formylmethanofuran--tetrahydromethanopterin N-formyltransferase [Methanobrevibacter woesei]|uniref:formylmethanofuran--tetrahydromethanopterin N-formyltransferase n=1 Tax=Methanobrevibacter woesei TaxID=190976 RepID=UPI0023F39042|nr:formylmethanofuran--tetrahydromethanopterin N-formyltransferase [Methanobrevibacter woesei]MCI7290609.1 formylmethanofuran--tetrahydromethanopterin N-formyltransferase [Methanobrevibacter woesei]